MPLRDFDEVRERLVLRVEPRSLVQLAMGGIVLISLAFGVGYWLGRSSVVEASGTRIQAATTREANPTGTAPTEPAPAEPEPARRPAYVLQLAEEPILPRPVEATTERKPSPPDPVEAITERKPPPPRPVEAVTERKPVPPTVRLPPEPPPPAWLVARLRWVRSLAAAVRPAPALGGLRASLASGVAVAVWQARWVAPGTEAAEALRVWLDRVNSRPRLGLALGTVRASADSGVATSLWRAPWLPPGAHGLVVLQDWIRRASRTALPRIGLDRASRSSGVAAATWAAPWPPAPPVVEVAVAPVPRGVAPAAPAQPSLPRMAPRKFVVQVRALGNATEAAALAEDLQRKGWQASVSSVVIADKGTFHRVRIGPFHTQDAAKALQKKFEAQQGPGTVVLGQP